jgi:hypothetical protein
MDIMYTGLQPDLRTPLVLTWFFWKFVPAHTFAN